MNNTFKTLIVDDEPGARNFIRSYASQYKEIEIIGECSTGEQAIAAIKEDSPDVVFLDIQMPNMNGFDVLKCIKAPYPIIIFVTAFDDFAIRAFEVNALDYLLKPFDKERFDKTIQRLLSAHRDLFTSQQLKQFILSIQDDSDTSYKNKLIVKHKSKSIFIHVGDIECIEGYDNYTKIYTKEGYKVANYTLKYLESDLNPEVFTRIHKSYIVNIKKVKAIEPFTHGEYILYLESGKEIKLSRSYKDKLPMIIE